MKRSLLRILPALVPAFLCLAAVQAPAQTLGECTVHAGAGTGKALATAPVADHSIKACVDKIPKPGDYTLKVKATKLAEPPVVTPPVVTPPAVTWVLVGPEKASYTLTGRYKVRFGTGTGVWAVRVIEGAFSCGTTLFGDPAPGAAKRCERESVTTTEPLTAPPVVAPPVIEPPVVVPPVVVPPVVTSPAGGLSVPSETAFVTRPVSGARTLSNNEVLENLRISSSDGPCITIPAGVSNTVTRNVEIGPCGGPEGKGVDIRPGAGPNHRVESSFIHDVTTGVYIDRGVHPIRVTFNRFKHLRGPKPRGQICQFNTVGNNGSERSACSDNLSYGHEDVEDHVSVFNTSNVDVDCNNFTSGSKTSRSGTAIMLGDGDGRGGNNRARNNIVVNVTNVGGGIAGGRNNELSGNWIYMNRDAGLYTNVGLYVWMQGEGAAGSCSGSKVTNNRVWVMNTNGAQNPWWNNGNCGAVELSGNVFGDSTLSASIIGQKHPACQ